MGRQLHKLDADTTAATAIADRKSWMLDNFKIASATGKLGYERDPAEDGGRVSTYIKRFEGAQISAAIQFSGHYIAENKQMPCALISVSFAPTTRGRSLSGARPLDKIAPVLSSEVWGDLHAIAASGSGFDKDWEKKTGL